MINAAHKALAVCLIAAILAVGAYAISLTHVYFTYTVTFGDKPTEQVAMADALDMSTLTLPTPQHKPRPVK